LKHPDQELTKKEEQMFLGLPLLIHS